MAVPACFFTEECCEYMDKFVKYFLCVVSGGRAVVFYFRESPCVVEGERQKQTREQHKHSAPCERNITCVLFDDSGHHHKRALAYYGGYAVKCGTDAYIE